MSNKQVKILCRFLIWLSIALLIAFIGISNIFALETKTIYPNSDFTQNANNYIKLNSNGTAGITNVNLTIQGVSYGFYFSMPEQVSNNKTYTMVINFMDLDLLQSFQSSYVHISSCDSNSSCVDSTIISVTKSSSTGNSNKLTIKFNAVANGVYFNVGLASDGPPYQALTGISTFGIKNVQLESSNTSEDIINNQNQNTNNIINNNNSNTQEIIDSSASNTEEIINNQNQNTQAIINAQYTCKTRSITLNNYVEYQGYYLNSSGVLGSASNYSVTEYIKIKTNSPYTINLNYTTSNRYCLYDKDLVLITCPSYSGSREINFNSSNAEFVRFTIRTETSSYTTFLGGNICLKDIKEQTNAINDLNDNISSTDFDISGLDNVVGWLPAGPVDSILNLPLNLFNAYTTALGLTCNPLIIPLPYVNKNLPIPCIRSILQDIGILTWWDGFGYLASAIILYNYLLSLYTWVDKTLTLRENTMPGYYEDKFGGGA